MQHDDDYITAILATMPETQIGDAEKHASETKKLASPNFRHRCKSHRWRRNPHHRLVIIGDAFFAKMRLQW